MKQQIWKNLFSSHETKSNRVISLLEQKNILVSVCIAFFNFPSLSVFFTRSSRLSCSIEPLCKHSEEIFPVSVKILFSSSTSKRMLSGSLFCCLKQCITQIIFLISIQHCWKITKYIFYPNVSRFCKVLACICSDCLMIRFASSSLSLACSAFCRCSCCSFSRLENI